INDYPMLTIPAHYDARWSHFRWLDEFARDVELRQLGSVSVVGAPDPLSEMPGKGPAERGAELVASIVDAIASSPYKDETLVLVVHLWSGGFYGHVTQPPPPPSALDPKGLPYGPRVPFLALGPFAKVNAISHVPLEPTSITKFIEWNWIGGVTGQLGGRDMTI